MLIPYINFTGQAAEAIAFYETVFEVKNKEVMLYKDVPEDTKRSFPPGTDHYVAHAELTINGTIVWIGDSLKEAIPGTKVVIAIPLSSKEAAREVFDKLKAGGTVLMELESTFYSPAVGVIKDKFGVVWHPIVININQNK